MKWFKGDKEDLSDVFYVRREVFVNEQQVSEDVEFVGDDGECIHLVMYDDGNPVATGRVLVGDDDFKIGRVATLKSHRGRGIASNVIQSLVGVCNVMGSKRQYVHAQVSARAFYEKLGFVAYGDEVDVAGVTHIAMEHTGRKCGGGCGGCSGGCG